MRITIDNDFSNDPRFVILAKNVGCADKAIGMCRRLWMSAQFYWTKNQQLIPKAVFNNSDFGPLVDACLLIEQDDGYYACGTKDKFAWHQKRIEAGRIGGINNASKRQANVKQTQANDEQDLSKDKQGYSKIKPPTPTPTPTQTQNNNLSVVKRARARTERPHTTRQKLQIASTQGATRVIAVFQTSGRDEAAAREALGPTIWEILYQKYPLNTWGQWFSEYSNHVNRKATQFFVKDLKAHFEAFIPLVAPPKPANSDDNALNPDNPNSDTLKIESQ